MKPDAEPPRKMGKLLQFRRILDRADAQEGATDEELAFLRSLREASREAPHSVRVDDEPTAS